MQKKKIATKRMRINLKKLNLGREKFEKKTILKMIPKKFLKNKRIRTIFETRKNHRGEIKKHLSFDRLFIY